MPVDATALVIPGILAALSYVLDFAVTGTALGMVASELALWRSPCLGCCCRSAS